jgi:hypothetical protein
LIVGAVVIIDEKCIIAFPLDEIPQPILKLRERAPKQVSTNPSKLINQVRGAEKNFTDLMTRVLKIQG